MDYSITENAARTNADQSETQADFRVSFESRSRSGLWDAERARVYFIGGAGLIKIGVTTDVDTRFRQVSLSSPVEVAYLGSFAGTQRDERELQDKFKHLRKHGEWFQDTAELRSEILARCGGLWMEGYDAPKG